MLDSGSAASAARSEIFISYSRRDAVWLERLRVHLEPLVQRDRLRVWDDGRIQPGEQWRDELREAVARARVAVLLVSPDYLASPFIAREELPPILRAAETEGLRVFWIPVRASIVERTELGRMQAAQPPDKPLAGLRGPAVDRALAAVAQSILEVFAPTPDDDAAAATFVELDGPSRAGRVPFQGDRMTVGRAVGNDIVLADGEASRWHAVIERFGPYWYIRDLGSSNGTSVNGQRVGTERRLQPGDQIRIGRSSLLFHGADPPPADDTTRAATGPPDLTAAERDVLVALARPLASGRAAAEPATDAEIALALGLGGGDVISHVARLVEKFDVPPGAAERTRLADEAIKRGAISATGLADHSPAAQ